MTKPPGDARKKLLDAAVAVIRANGYRAATVAEICRAAGVTKGAFFHHFASKDELAVAAAEHNAVLADAVFSEAPYLKLRDPLDRLLSWVEFRKELLQGDLSEYTCLIGTMVQETYETHPPIREACERQLRDAAAVVAPDIAAAMDSYGIDAEWSAESLAFFTQAVIQGALILAKAQHGPAVAADCFDHLRRYLELLFDRAPRRRSHRPAKSPTVQ